MATHQELTDLFSAEGVVRLPLQDALAHKVQDTDAHILAEVGLPAQLDVVFSLAPPAAPEAFTLLPVDTGDGIVNVLTLGGPAAGAEMCFCLDLEDGYVILLTIGEQPAAEIINSTLADFIEFLYRYGLRMKHVTGTTDQQADAYTEQLRSYLEAKDPQAFAEADNWWSMVFDRLLEEDS